MGDVSDTGAGSCHCGADLMRVRAQQYDTVDSLCWRHYGRTQGVTERVLAANPGLADVGAILPQGTEIELPEITPAAVTPVIQLWD